MSRTRALKERARAAGFELAGVARAGPAPRGEFLESWLARGFHGTMEFLSRDPARRRDPSRLLPGARSILCVAMGYFTGSPPEEDPRRARISRHALGRDYHGVMRERLLRLAGAVEEMGGRWRIFADAGPVMEKPWAERAGLGWQGGNSLLLHERYGSWLLLGEVVTDLDLEPDPPGLDRCGDCRICLERCPAGALVAPGVLEARRCLSYLTAEHRGAIPREARPLLGNRIFGCDRCQEVCPWNRAVPESPGGKAGRSPGEAPRLVDLAEMSPEEFSERFRGSAVRRAGYTGLLRNVMVALGNSGDGSAVPVLERCLGHPDSLVRSHAAWALGKLGAREVLRARLAVERDPEVRAEMEGALG